MEKQDTSPNIQHELQAFRGQIDALDDKIIALLKERIGIVGKVGEYKRRHFPGQCPIRAGREADLVRRIAKEFEGSAMLPASAAAIWRTLIAASIMHEAPLPVSVYCADANQDFYWLAREYFGLFAPTSKQPHVKRVIGDVMDGKAAVGIVPALHSHDSSYWWTNLATRQENQPKIFACLPFIYHGAPGRDAARCLAIAKVQPEETGDDRSIFVIEADQHISQHKLQTAFASAGLEAEWISIATLSAHTRHHLVEIKGFFDAHHPALQRLQAAFANPAISISFLGAYANPLILKAAHPHSENALATAGLRQQKPSSL